MLNDSEQWVERGLRPQDKATSGFPREKGKKVRAHGLGKDVSGSNSRIQAIGLATQQGRGAAVADETAETPSGLTPATPHRRRASSARVGFDPRSETLHRAYNFSIALFLVLMALPLMAVISALLLATQGPSIFHRGVRMGKNEKPFHILKFRTLNATTAAALTQDRVLPKHSGIETPLGAFLRETRLDELPQLFNVLLGDMNICGPRPVRPEITRAHEGTIPSYRIRFRVKPGMLGPTQACMNHGASKRIRSRLNAKLCCTPVSYRSEAGLIAVVGACVMARTISRLRPALADLLGIGARDIAEERAATFDVRIETAEAAISPVRGITADHLVSAHAIGSGAGRLLFTLPDGRKRSARIVLMEEASTAVPQGCRYVAADDLSDYMLSRYLFEEVVVPHRSRHLWASLERGWRLAWSPRAPNRIREGRHQVAD